MAAILNFRIFAKNRKTGICFYLLNKRLIGWTLHMIMCVLLCYPVSIHMSQLQATGRPISSFYKKYTYGSAKWLFFCMEKMF